MATHPHPAATPPPDRPRHGVGPRLGLALTLLACALIYWPRLGDSGLSRSEGHRVLPAWEMLERGEWVVPRLFGQAYLRKPPGMPWAIAASSLLLGRTEFAARAVSAACATLSAVVAFGFAARWFGPRWGGAAGLACALMPMFWGSARSAEIECLNDLGTQATLLAILDLLLFRAYGGGPARVGLMTALIAAGLVIAGLAKGPASAPCVAGALLSVCLVRRSWRALGSAALWGALLASAVVLGVVAWAIARAVSGEPAVTQGPGDFLWNSQRLSWAGVAEVLRLAPESLALGAPMTIAMLFLFGRDVQRLAGSSDTARREWAFATAAAWTCLFSVILMTLAGVHNARYTFPAFTVVPLVVAWALKGREGGLSRARRLIGRVLLLGHAAVPAVLLLGAGLLYVHFETVYRLESSGRDAGAALAPFLPDGAEVRADAMIEARPEVPHYAREAARRDGRRVAVRWVPGLSAGATPPTPGTFLLLRCDPGFDEFGLARRAGLGDAWVEAARGRVHQFEFVLIRAAE